ncbi:MAG TPA: hypothetical protein VFZ70_02850 [Euzebyales bacterium]
MNDDAGTTPEDALRRWLGEDASTVTAGADETGQRGGRMPRRVGIAALVLLPWAALALAVVSGDTTSSTGAPRAGMNPAGTADRHETPDGGGRSMPTAGAPATGDPAREPTDAVDDESAGDDGPTTAGDGGRPAPAGIGPTALRLVRDAVTRTGAQTSALDTAAVERPTRLAAGVWLVRVHAVVLRGDRTRWRSADHEIWAVPVGRRGGDLVGLEQPWRVSAAPTRTATTAWRRTTVDTAAVRTALRRAGFDAARVDVRRHPTLDAILRVRTDHGWVWVRSTPRPGVLGAEPQVTS